jgi:hypothetical protein
MDILNNVTGRGLDGYPVSVEVIEVLNRHHKYYQAIMDGLRLPQGTCVLLSYDLPPFVTEESYIHNAMVYIVLKNQIAGYSRGEIFVLEDIDGVTASELIDGTQQRSINVSQQSLELTHAPNGVGGDGYKQWADAIRYRKAQIVPVNMINQRPAYNFTTLRDLLFFKDYQNVLLNLSGINYLALDANYNNRFRISNSDIEIKMKLIYTRQGVVQHDVEIPISSYTGQALQFLCHADEEGFEYTKMGVAKIVNSGGWKMILSFEYALSGSVEIYLNARIAL